jgi:hypothetical protein
VELTLELLICPLPGYNASPGWNDAQRGRHLGILDCTLNNDYLLRPAILLQSINGSNERFYRCHGDPVLLYVNIDGPPEGKSLNSRTSDES